MRLRPLTFAVVALGATRGAAACDVRLSPGAGSRWEKAVEVLRGRLAQPDAENDCREVTVEVRNDGAELRFATKDGRVARRSLAAPEDLGPQVDALVVAAASFAPPPPESRSPPATPASPPTAALFAHGAAGVRVAGAGSRPSPRYATPQLTAGMHGLVGPWELGVFVEWAPRYFDLSKDELPGFTMSSVGLGVGVGRRTALGPGTLRYGLTMVIVQVDARLEGPDGTETSAKEAAQTQAGLLAGWVLPSAKGTRFSAALRTDAVISRGTGKKAEADRALPPLPGFGAMLTFGVETKVL